MDDRRFGRLLREVRIHKRLRQQDLADRAGVSRAQISAAERGRVEQVSLAVLRRIGTALGIRVSLDGWWMDGRIDQLLDQAHAALVEHAVRTLRGAGWEARVEYTFSEFGERGSVDVLGWRATERTLLITEVKSRIDDVQDTAAAFARKIRLIPMIVERDEGWRPQTVIRLLVMLDTRQNRDVVSRHRATFDTIWPGRTLDVRRWLRGMVGPGDASGGIWFVPRPLLGAAVARTVARVRPSRRPTGQLP